MRKTVWGHILATRQCSKVVLSGGLINFKLHRDINITLIVCPQWCLLFLPWAESKVEKVNQNQFFWFVLLSCWCCRIPKGGSLSSVKALLSHCSCFPWTGCGQAEWHLYTWSNWGKFCENAELSPSLSSPWYTGICQQLDYFILCTPPKSHSHIGEVFSFLPVFDCHCSHGPSASPKWYNNDLLAKDNQTNNFTGRGWLPCVQPLS